MNSLRTLFFPILLAVIWLVADEFFSPTISVPCIIILGAIELIHTRLKEKKWNRIILLTTLLFSLPGIITLLAEGSAANRLQPVITGSILCLLTGLFAFARTDITATLPTSFRNNVQITPAQQHAMRKLMKILFFILCGHTLITACAILFMPETTVSFISGTLLYIILGSFFGTLLLRSLIAKRRMQREEWLPIVNEKGEVTGKAPRSLCHSGSKLLHPVVHLHITNDRNELFLQKRSMKKDLLPGKWDTAVGGHIGIGEKIEDALRRETFEELGIEQFEARFIGNYIWESPRERELVFSFLCTSHSPIHIDNDEVDEGRFWTAAEIEDRAKLLTPNFLHEYNTLLKKTLSHLPG